MVVRKKFTVDLGQSIEGASEEKENNCGDTRFFGTTLFFFCYPYNEEWRRAIQ